VVVDDSITRTIYARMCILYVGGPESPEPSILLRCLGLVIPYSPALNMTGWIDLKTICLRMTWINQENIRRSTPPVLPNDKIN